VDGFQGEQGGFVGTIFTALTFTILSFACVAPFLGGFGGAAASEQFTFLERFLGGLVFAITFASPFFILALFPSLLRKLPKSGTWLNSVKVVMGFLELAAAFKFLRLGEMLLSSKGVSFFTYDLVLGLWIALAILCALYLLNFYRLPNDTPLESLGVPRVLLAGVFLCLAFYMLPALFKYNAEGGQQRPNGSVYAWIDSFLLPDKSVSTELVWSGDLKKMIAEARQDGERADKTPRILIDVTGKSCTNCRINEQDVFPRPEITSLMHKYKLVELYTDVVPAEFYSGPVDLERVKADGRTNYDFEDKAFKNVELPLYAIIALEPGNRLRIVDTYGGRITNVEEFASFLRDNSGAK
jgi:thiol:disulfide interchange protein DsbD